MNFAKYTNTYPYPTTADITSTYYYKQGKLVAIGTMKSMDHKIPDIALRECIKEFIVDDVGFKSERKKYYENGANLLAQF